MAGEEVPAVTVMSLVKSQYIVDPNDKYHTCKTDHCAVIYYSNEKSYLAEQIKVPVWYKSDSKLKILCYCSHVTTDDIENAVATLETKNVKEIIKATGAMQNCDCIHKNPTGKCCLKEITQFIETL